MKIIHGKSNIRECRPRPGHVFDPCQIPPCPPLQKGSWGDFPKTFMTNPAAGLTLIEVLLSLAIGSVFALLLGQVVGGALQAWSGSQVKHDLTQEARFAMQRMDAAVRDAGELMIPFIDNVPRNVLAVTLGPDIDQDANGIADADNDGNGLVDEDCPSDNTNDGAPGIVGIDDDGDTSTDEGSVNENREDGSGYTASCDSGGTGNDWLDPVVYYLQGTTLMERMPNLNPADGNDYTEHPLVENVTNFSATRRPQGRRVIVEITLDVANGNETINLSSRIRLGGAK